jgi:mannose-6-phosphate isomerase-like protein (cupin superfamily)
MTRQPTLRRIITGLDDDGRSVVAVDGPPSTVLEWEGGSGLYEIWTDTGSTSRHVDDKGPDGAPIKLAPPAGGFKVRWFTAVPEDPTLTPSVKAAATAQAFAAIQAQGDQHDTSRHPAMHATQTIDVIVVISGRVRLLLDDDERVLGPGDVVMQRGTNHAWIAEGEDPVLMVAVLIDRPAWNGS